MGYSIEEQRQRIRARNKLLGLTEQSFIKPKKKTKKKDKSVLFRNKKKAYKLMENQLNLKSPNEIIFKTLLIENGIKHTWQKPFFDIDRYVCVDFYFPESNIVVEIDGSEHNDRQQYDLERTMYLKKVHGVKEVLRVTNKQLALNHEEVIDLLFDKL
jgi:very-short-patch-repair endonuclease